MQSEIKNFIILLNQKNFNLYFMNHLEILNKLFKFISNYLK